MTFCKIYKETPVTEFFFVKLQTKSATVLKRHSKTVDFF